MKSISLAVLQHLRSSGPSTRAELQGALPCMPRATINNLLKLGYLATDEARPNTRYSITRSGSTRLDEGEAPRLSVAREPRPRPAAVPAPHRYPVALPRSITVMSGRYAGVEMRPSARPGAMTAHQQPSRMSNRLHWPDGRITDLNHNPIEEPNHG